MDKLIILGHTGFLGKSLMSYFQSKKYFKSIIGFSSKDADLTDLTHLSRIADKCNKDTIIIMCAAIKSDEGNSLKTFQKNVRMAENISKLALECKLKKLVLISSNAVYGVHKKHKIISEETHVHPDTYYSLSKLVTERLLQIGFAGEENKLIILRPSTLYGPGETITPHTPSGFLNTYLNGGIVTLWGDGSELREFVFIDDMVRLVVNIIQSEFNGVLNIGGGKPRSYKDALDIISKILNKKILINSKTRTIAPVDKIYDLSKIQNLFPTFKFTSLEEGLKQTYKRTMA